MTEPIPGIPAMPPPTPIPNRQQSQGQWVGFAVILAGLLMVGGAFCFMSLWAVAMITDPCGAGNTEQVCTMSASGQNLLFFVPWVALAALGAGSVIAALLLARRRLTPLLGIPAGLVVGYAVFQIGTWIALHI